MNGSTQGEIMAQRLHTAYYRRSGVTGDIEQLPFSEVDGVHWGVRFERGQGICFTEAVALAIVNRWNFISANQPGSAPRPFYYID